MTETTALMIADVMIIQDTHGRYNLNSLHQASGSGEAKKPGHWLKRASTKALHTALESQVSFLTLDVVVGGDRAGTYAHELLAVEYAGWISPTFRLKVNQAFIDSRNAMRLPKVHDHRTQIAIDTLVRLDAVEYELAAQRQIVHSAQNMALEILRAQTWMTIRQYVYLHDLTRQLPPGQQRAYATWLGSYCLEQGIPMYKAMTADVAWPDERTYHIGTMQETLQPWLGRRHGQAPLALLRPCSAKE